MNFVMKRANIKPDSGTSDSPAKQELERQTDDTDRYHQFGLGRGINVTDPEMWKNKSSVLVREVSDNIIITNECDRKEAYTKEVASVEVQQQNVQLSLDDPNSRFKIAMDAQHSQSASFSTIVSGTKCETKLISFKSDFNDVPLYTTPDSMSLEAPDSINSSFERNLSCWILKRIRDRIIKNRRKSGDTITEESAYIQADSSAVKNLANTLTVLISSDDPEERQRNTQLVTLRLNNDCLDFLKNLGVTHYVSAIKLGAMKYKVVAISRKEKAVGGFMISSTAKGGPSEQVSRGLFQKKEQERHIGKLNGDGTVQEEAVIEFQIQPLDTLVRVQFIQVALRQAIKEYVRSMTDKCRKCNTLHVILRSVCILYGLMI